MEWIFLKLLEPLCKRQLHYLATFAKREGQLPLYAFRELTHVVPYAAFELLIIRQTPSGKEILLTRREPNDPAWPHLWHFPGTIARITDTIERITTRWEQELGVSPLPAQPRYLAMQFDDDHPCGRTLHLFHVMEVSLLFEPVEGMFHPLNDLPSDMIGFQVSQLSTLRAKKTL